MKKIILSLMLLLPLSMIAQEIKIAIVNQNDVFNAMPEATAMENEMSILMQKWNAELQSMENDFNRKYGELIAQQDSLSENIRMMRVQEIEDMRTRMENLVQVAQQDRDKKYEELLTPIQEKMQKAIDEVGEENGYTVIINPQVLLFTGKSVIDATDKVKAKLGVK